MRVLEGKLVASGLKVGIVAARFNEFIVSKLVSGALDGLKRHDVKEEDIDIAWVPGAFEIPLIADKMAKSKKYDAVICLGTVIRGATSHYDYVCNEVSKGIAQVSLNTGIVLFVILLFLINLLLIFYNFLVNIEVEAGIEPTLYVYNPHEFPKLRYTLYGYYISLDFTL